MHINRVEAMGKEVVFMIMVCLFGLFFFWVFSLETDPFKIFFIKTVVDNFEGISVFFCLFFIVARVEEDFFNKADEEYFSFGIVFCIESFVDGIDKLLVGLEW